jgi:hypothetical protein
MLLDIKSLYVQLFYHITEPSLCQEYNLKMAVYNYAEIIELF